jgi:predicted TIM-barrel enzyme
MSTKLLVPVDWTDEEVEVLRKTHAGSLAVTPYTKAADEAEFVW